MTSKKDQLRAEALDAIRINIEHRGPYVCLPVREGPGGHPDKQFASYRVRIGGRIEWAWIEEVWLEAGKLMGKGLVINADSPLPPIFELDTIAVRDLCALAWILDRERPVLPG
jgi:hypothetical protein